ncbi:hypothetical protein EPN15_04830 [Patescibacteria group bacterium]|nr:MAG: hypothetical protein EPN15_04830 [Patescibacteria group bacterium]
MIPRKMQSALWSYDLRSLNSKRHKNLIITQVLNFGTWEQVQWLLKHYTKNDLRNAIKQPSRGIWRPDSLNYWMLILDVKLPKSKIQRAIFSLEPSYPNLRKTHHA